MVFAAMKKMLTDSEGGQTMTTRTNVQLNSGIDRWYPGGLGLSLLLALIGGLIAGGSRAEGCWRESVNSDWQASKFNFATWGDVEQSRALLVSMFDRKSLELALSRDIVSGSVTVEQSLSASRAGDYYPKESLTAVGDEPVREIVYGIKRSNGGFVGLNLNLGNGIPSSIQWFDASLLKRGRTELVSRVGMTGELIEDNRVMSMFDWQPVADQFFAYGALGIDGRLDVVREGFYLTQVQTPGNANVTPKAQMIWDVPGYRHYAFHHEFIAVAGDLVYFLEMSTSPSLHYYDTRDGSRGRLEGFPGSNESMPYPPAGTVAEMYKSVEGMKIPVGLYSVGEFLYALLRGPEGRRPGVTTWRVVKLEPDFNKGIVQVLGEVRLPTQRATRHLYVLSGEAFWLALELDSWLPRAKKHRLLAATTIPENWISEPESSPLEQGRPPIDCLTAAAR